MGKIRVKTFGIEELEEKQKKEARLAREVRQARKQAEQKKFVKGAKGGERIVAVGPTEEDLARLEAPEATKVSKVSQEKVSKATKASKVAKEQRRSNKYHAVAKMVDRTKSYSLQEALTLLAKIHLASFDETVELHINTIDKGISATTTLPHGSGKKTRVEIADDETIDNVAKGKIDFDVLLATPAMLPKLARVAKFLGPRGLMPNPKNQTITENPKELAKKYEEGQITFKTETKSPIMHISVGKLSIGADKLMNNIQVVFKAIKAQNIKNVTLKSSMSPGIRIQLD